MKQKLLLKTLLLLCALVAGSSSVWAGSYTYTFSEGANGFYTTSALTDNPGSGSGNVLSSFYASDGKQFTATGNVYFSAASSGYLMAKSGCTITLPTYSGEKITSITLKNSSGCSVNTSVKIMSGSNTAASAQTWSTQSGTYNYSIGTSYQTTTLKISVSSANAQITEMTVTTATTPVLDHIVLSGTYPTEFEQGAEFSHTGMTVTAHYGDASTVDVTNSATFSGYNMNTLGDQTVTVSYTENAVTKTANYGINIVPAIPPVVTLDFSTNTGWGLPTTGTNTSATSYTSGGYTVTLAAPNNYYFDTNNVMLGKNGATLTLPAFGFNVSKIKVCGFANGSKDVTFNVYVGNNAVSTAATSSKVDHEFIIAADKRDVGTIYVIKVTNNNNMRFTGIKIYGNGCEAGLVTSYGWATYITTADVQYPANTAFVVTDASVSGNSGTLTMEEVTQVPSGTPLLLKGEGAKTAISLDAAPAAPATNLLSVSNGSFAAGEYPYVLAKDGEGACFKQWTGTAATLNGRVVLLLDESIATAPVFTLDSNETTGINAVNGSEFKVNGEYYNLAGQRVANPTKGLYIVNGKKVIIK